MMEVLGRRQRAAPTYLTAADLDVDGERPILGL